MRAAVGITSATSVCSSRAASREYTSTHGYHSNEPGQIIYIARLSQTEMHISLGLNPPTAAMIPVYVDAWSLDGALPLTRSS